MEFSSLESHLFLVTEVSYSSSFFMSNFSLILLLMKYDLIKCVLHFHWVEIWAFCSFSSLFLLDVFFESEMPVFHNCCGSLLLSFYQDLSMVFSALLLPRFSLSSVSSIVVALMSGYHSLPLCFYSVAFFDWIPCWPCGWAWVSLLKGLTKRIFFDLFS